MENIVIIGAGGVGRETAWIINQINEKENKWNILGFVDDDKRIHGTKVNDHLVLGGLDILSKINVRFKIIIAIANFNVKKKIVENLNNSYEYSNIIHPNVSIDKSIKLGTGIIIYPGVILTTNICLGNHVILSPNCGIGHDSIIDAYVTLLWNCNISGSCSIREGVLIGSGATVIQNIEVGRGSIIGAGSVVIRNIYKNKVAVGVPSKEIKSLL